MKTPTRITPTGAIWIVTAAVGLLCVLVLAAQKVVRAQEAPPPPAPEAPAKPTPAPTAPAAAAVATPAAPAAPEPIPPASPVPPAPTNSAVPKSAAAPQPSERSNVTATPDTVQMSPEAAPPTGTATATPGFATNLISVTLDQVPLQDVVRMFTRISGANIIASASNLQGTVTVNLQDVEWKPALSAILDMHNLSLVERTPGSGVFSILPKPVGATEPLAIQTFPLKYASVSNIAALVTPLLSQGSTIASYPSLNTLVVRSTAANVNDIRMVLDVLDRPRQQVYIEAKFLELSDSAIKDLGIDWQVLQNFGLKAGNLQWSTTENRDWLQTRDDKTSQWDKRQNVDTLSKTYDVNNAQYQQQVTTYVESPPGSGVYVPQTQTTPTRTVVDTIDRAKNITSDMEDSFTKKVADVRTAVLSADDFKLVLSALKTVNGVSIVSNPKIIVANEETATIHIGDTERPFISSVTPGQQGIAPVVTYNPGDPVDFGVKVKVTPTVNTEDHISVSIEPELTRFNQNAVAPNGQTYPIISRKTIRTVFSLASGKTAAIGGLTETDERDVVSSVPLLGDIPLLGKYLFSHTHKEKTQQETIIFVTVGMANPDIISRDIGLPEDTDLMRKRMLKNEAERQLHGDAGSDKNSAGGRQDSGSAKP